MRLFVAVWPPPEIVKRLESLDRPAVDGLRWTTAEQWHVTLRFLGDADVVAAKDAFGRMSAAGHTTAELGPVSGRFGRRVLHVAVSGLEGLAAAAGAATSGVGRAPDGRPFSGHVTLARARDRRGVNLRPLAGVAVAGSWPVGEVSLVASHLGGRGPARYEVVETLSLQG